ncbi:MAG: YlbF family regulator [Clostridia bacterium]|jgi:cell fate (sporulation/competence/biofilm development) regulator YlbF (YheA/YmcA/DUF963 family)
MDIMSKAKELGDLIADSPEMNRLSLAEETVQMDEKSINLLNEYKKFQIEVVNAVKKNEDKTEIEALKDKLMKKQQELNDYDVTHEFFDSKMKFDALMKTINNVIVHAITGEETCSSDDCNTCGGGCKH